jgi:hypothetical protein
VQMRRTVRRRTRGDTAKTAGGGRLASRHAGELDGLGLRAPAGLRSREAVSLAGAPLRIRAVGVTWGCRQPRCRARRGRHLWRSDDQSIGREPHGRAQECGEECAWEHIRLCAHPGRSVNEACPTSLEALPHRSSAHARSVASSDRTAGLQPPTAAPDPRQRQHQRADGHVTRAGRRRGARADVVCRETLDGGGPKRV